MKVRAILGCTCVSLAVGCGSSSNGADEPAQTTKPTSSTKPTGPVKPSNPSTSPEPSSSAEPSKPGQDPTPVEDPSPSTVTPDTTDNPQPSPSEPEQPAKPVELGAPIEPDVPSGVDLSFEVRTDRDLHPISRLIYGVNGGGLDCSDTAIRATLCRFGGNRWTNYNWENNASNAGSDWCYENDSLLGDTDDPAAPATELVGQLGSDVTALITIPIVDYVSADKEGGSGPPECSGDVRNSGDDYLSTRFKKNHASKGAELADPPDPSDGDVYQDEFVAYLKTRAGETHVAFSLDNEPDLWSSTHAQSHPDPVTYAELVSRNVEYATAIRSQWPEAEITGFVSYGFNGYVNLQSAPDADGKPEFVDYYLASMKQAEDDAGKRLVDYLDLHWYSEAQGDGQRITNADSSPGVVAARVQAPRSLWDDTYTEDSWITSYTGGPIRLIPWLREKIDSNYPDTKLAFTEWNYGGGSDISGAVAASDVLGTFGRLGVGLASYWPLSDSEDYAMAAFAAFRNYDGQGAHFGDTSIHASSSNVERAAVYASVDSANPNRVIVIALNRDTAQIHSGLSIAHPAELTHAQVFRLDDSGPTLHAVDPIDAVGTNAFELDLPSMTVSVIVVE